MRPQYADVMLRIVDEGQLKTAEVDWQTYSVCGAKMKGRTQDSYQNNYTSSQTVKAVTSSNHNKITTFFTARGQRHSTS